MKKVCKHDWIRCEDVIHSGWLFCPAGGKICKKCNTLLLKGTIKAQQEVLGRIKKVGK